MQNKGGIKAAVYGAIMEDIVRGEHRPGEILNEGQLVAQFKCSRAPVREALADLCNEGVLKNLPRCGYEVVRIAMDDVKNILQFRQLLEGGLLPDVYQNLSPHRYQVLQELADKCNRQDVTMWDHWEYNTQFHLKLISYSGNLFAEQMLRQTMRFLKCAYGQHYWDKWDHVFPSDMTYHSKILEALRKGDVSKAVEYLSMDLGDFAVFS